MKETWNAEAVPRKVSFNRTLLLMAITSIAELAMLGAIFLAHAQGSVAGLGLAVIWPWIAALVTSKQLAANGRQPRANSRRTGSMSRRLEVRTW